MSLEDVLAANTAATERVADALEEIRDLIKGAKISVGNGAPKSAKVDEDDEATDEATDEGEGDTLEEVEEKEPAKKKTKKVTSDDVLSVLRKLMTQDGKKAVAELLAKHGGGAKTVPSLEEKYFDKVIAEATKLLV
jgi:hypothetical protein